MSEYDKITLSKQDLRHVYGELLGETMAKLDLHLPSTHSDPLKNQVATVLDDFLKEVFEMAKSAMVVDGEDMEELGRAILELVSLKPKEIVEPFDVEVNNRLRDVLLQVEQETVLLTTMRRVLPEKARELYGRLVSDTDEDVSRVLEQLDKEEVEQGEEDQNEIDVDHEAIESYEKYVLLLDGLKNSVPETKMRLDRYDQALEFLEEVEEKRRREIGTDGR